VPEADTAWTEESRIVEEFWSITSMKTPSGSEGGGLIVPEIV
jgi:hypothetical protein